MEYLKKLFKNVGYIEGITIINIEGEILFSAKFNSKMKGQDENYEIVGKKFLDVYENLDENNSSTYKAMRYGVPVYVEDQKLVSVGQEPIRITSLSVPIKSRGSIVGAIDISVSPQEAAGDTDNIEILDVEGITDRILNSNNNVDTLRRTEEKAVYSLDDIQTNDPRMLELKSKIRKYAKSDLPVLIYGETGTGKELTAHSLHNLSGRADKPFVVQNCSSIPGNLIESILFGTSKGAFTGAIENTGLLEIADGGTIFLDEINSMPMDLQPKILRVIQDGTFRRVGGKDVRHVDVRIISSTNEPLAQAIQRNEFRKDLYYRLSVLTVEIPPLRERKGDIPLLVDYFVLKYDSEFKKNVHRVSSKVYEALSHYNMPGNVRELENIIASALVTIDDDKEVLRLSDVEDRLNPAGLFGSDIASMSENESDDMIVEMSSVDDYYAIGEGTLKECVAEFEKKLIKNALIRENGNVSKAAQQLGVPRQTLARKVKDYGLLQMP